MQTLVQMNVEEDDGEHVQGAATDARLDEWARLCAEYLPLTREGSIWKFSCGSAPGDPEQGWKLHISATVLTANEILKQVAPLLHESGVRFKALSSLRELRKLNSGLFYGYSQIGKFITVYPRTAEEATRLARRLDELTYGMSAPSVPFDLRLRPGSCVYYRYGSFKRIEIKNPDGTLTPAIRDPEGRLIPDVRDSATAKPDWVSDPFTEQTTPRDETPLVSPLMTTFRVFQALAQRGKGGIYKAVDLSVRPPRLCIVKEGRAGGELAWDGRDGHWRVWHEEHVLGGLRAAGVATPHVYSSFEVEGHHYLVTEFIEGETLQALLYKRRRRLSLARVLLYGARLASLLSRIHAAGWAWRDCKPANIIVTKGDDLRPVDFEGACRTERRDPSRWGTPGFAPPTPASEDSARAIISDDLYALGVILYLILTGRMPESPAFVPVERLRSNVPACVREMIADLLCADPNKRPDASAVAEELDAVRAVSGHQQRV